MIWKRGSYEEMIEQIQARHEVGKNPSFLAELAENRAKVEREQGESDRAKPNHKGKQQDTR
jgi:hypothetical protein